MLIIKKENLNDELKDCNISFEEVLKYLIINKMHIKFPFYVIYAEDNYAGNIDNCDSGYLTSLYTHNNGIENQYFVSISSSLKFRKPNNHEETYEFYKNLSKIKIFGPRKLTKAKEFIQKCNYYAGLSDCELRKINKVEDLYL